MNLYSFAFLFLWNIKGVILKNTIETIPPTPYNQLATGYFGLVVRAIFEKTDSTTNCGWRYNRDTTPPKEEPNFGELQFHIVGIGCVNRTNNSNETITCVAREIDGVTHFITNLTYLQPLSSDVVLAVRCNNGADLIIPLPTKTVRDCNQQLTANVVVNGNSRTYEADGTFGCDNNGKLFYANGSEPSSNQATCLLTAEWSGKDNLQCWTAPLTAISGNLTVIEGNNISLGCEYSDIIPEGNSSMFFFDDLSISKSKDEQFKLLSLQAADNNKIVSCQAITPYTKVHSERGRSPNYTINVLYAPFQESLSACKWLVNETGSCRVNFFSNPSAKFQSLKKESIDMGENFNSLQVISLSPFQQQAVIEKYLVTGNEGGSYDLHLKSFVPPYNHTITFDIILLEDSIISCTTDKTSIVNALSVIACLLLVTNAVCFVVIYKLRNAARNTKVKGERDYDEVKESSTTAEVQQSGEYMSPIQAIGGQTTYVEFGQTEVQTSTPAPKDGVYVNLQAMPMEVKDKR